MKLNVSNVTMIVVVGLIPKIFMGFCTIFVLYKVMVACRFWMEGKRFRRSEARLEENALHVVKTHLENEIEADDAVKTLHTIDRSDTVLLNKCLNDVASGIAYNIRRRFGRRPRSEANMLVTRKYSEKELAKIEESLKIKIKSKDACKILDQALCLSFINTETMLDELRDTYCYEEMTPGKY